MILMVFGPQDRIIWVLGPSGFSYLSLRQSSLSQVPSYLVHGPLGLASKDLGFLLEGLEWKHDPPAH